MRPKLVFGDRPPAPSTLKNDNELQNLQLDILLSYKSKTTN